MVYHGIDHIALRVADLRAAEEHYCTLFGASVAFREAKVADGWRTLPADAGWADADAAGITLELSVIARDGLHLALFATPEPIATNGFLDHVAVHVEGVDLDVLLQRVALLDGVIVHNHPGVLIADDRFGVRWEMTTLPKDYGSNGEVRGRWLDLGTARTE